MGPTTISMPDGYSLTGHVEICAAFSQYFASAGNLVDYTGPPLPAIDSGISLLPKPSFTLQLFSLGEVVNAYKL